MTRNTLPRVSPDSPFSSTLSSAPISRPEAPGVARPSHQHKDSQTTRRRSHVNAPSIATPRRSAPINSQPAPVNIEAELSTARSESKPNSPLMSTQEGARPDTPARTVTGDSSGDSLNPGGVAPNTDTAHHTEVLVTTTPPVALPDQTAPADLIDLRPQGSGLEEPFAATHLDTEATLAMPIGRPQRSNDKQ